MPIKDTQLRPFHKGNASPSLEEPPTMEHMLSSGNGTMVDIKFGSLFLLIKLEILMFLHSNRIKDGEAIAKIKAFHRIIVKASLQTITRTKVGDIIQNMVITVITDTMVTMDTNSKNPVQTKASEYRCKASSRKTTLMLYSPVQMMRSVSTSPMTILPRYLTSKAL